MLNVVRVTLIFALFLGCSKSFATASNCDEIQNDVDQVICANAKLKRLDEIMTYYYDKLKEKVESRELKSLLHVQDRWVRNRSRTCPQNDPPCLMEMYKERTLELRKKSENLVSYTIAKPAQLQGLRGTCSFKEVSFPDEMRIYAGGAYKGRKIDRQIDQSGHQATQFEVIVNSPDQSVALILGAYEPSIWNIAWSKGTRIEAVVATGYHRQIIAGLPKDTPVLNSSYMNRGDCGFLYVSEKQLRKINPLSQKVFSRNVSMVHYADKKGYLIMGNQMGTGDQLYTSRDNPPESFFDASLPMAGKAGLNDLVAKGYLRKVSKNDLQRWAQLMAEKHKEELPPVASGSSTSSFIPRNVHNGYVILKEIIIPAGLYGGNSAIFFLEKNVAFPDGKLGHSTLYDFNTLSCRGTGCGR